MIPALTVAIITALVLATIFLLPRRVVQNEGIVPAILLSCAIVVAFAGGLMGLLAFLYALGWLITQLLT